MPGTFPAYTLHDARHAENVVTLMGRLLGPRVGQVRVLEATLLILAAYFHDTGMVYSADDLAAATREPEFREFLDTDDDALLETHANGGVPTDSVIERYCRHRHADRVRVHLERVDPGLLEFDGIPVIDQLDLLCRSHNQPAAALLDPAFKTDFAFQADLRLCAVLLRLADIMDLDNSRTPAVIYDHLGLTDRASADRAVSDDEWRKHLAARGFQFPQQPVANYTVQFMATPDEPGVEHDLRRFLSVIEDELQMCRTRPRRVRRPMARICRFPAHRCRPDNQQRLQVRRVPVRAGSVIGPRSVRRRAALRNPVCLPAGVVAERARRRPSADPSARAGLGPDEPPRVEVTCWEDAGGYIWVRIDDDGIGMDEEAIRNYFLKVGRSYYRSAEFKADLVRKGKAGRPFGVISRFGIGVLSCFMAGDRIEVSTRQIRADGSLAKSIRLALTRDHDFFVLQEQGRRGTPMPTASGDGDAFRTEPGTSVAVRIDPHRTGIERE